MSVVVEVFKRIQLFCFAFSLAASTMMLVGMTSGKMDRGPVYMGLAEKFATFFITNTTLVDMLAGNRATVTDARYRQADLLTQDALSEISPRVSRNSLQALKQRQLQRVVVPSEFNSGG